MWYFSNLQSGRIWHKVILMWGAVHKSRQMRGCHKNVWSRWYPAIGAPQVSSNEAGIAWGGFLDHSTGMPDRRPFWRLLNIRIYVMYLPTPRFLTRRNVTFAGYEKSSSSPARVSLTLSRHFSLLFIASGRSSGLHPVSSQSCCM